MPKDAVVEFVGRFGRSLASRSGDPGPWRFSVVRDYSANAYSIGDGYIYITEGALLLADGDSELAAMLAHEMGHQQEGHFCTRHTPKGWLDRLFGWMLPGYGDSDSATQTTATKGSLRQGWDPAKEREANAQARKVLAAARYDPAAVDRVAWKLENRLHEGSSPDSARRTFDPAQGGTSSASGIPRNGDSELQRIQKLLREQRP